MTHVRNHAAKKQLVQCPFLGCTHSTNVASTFRSHQSRCHATACRADLKLGIYASNKEEEGARDMLVDEVDDDGSDVEVQSPAAISDLDDSVMHNMGLFFLQLQVVCGVPASAVQTIIDGFNNLLSLSQPLAVNSVAETLQTHQVNPKVAEEVIHTLNSDIPLQKYTRKGGLLSTHKKRMAYYKSSFAYVKPTELVLGERAGKACTYAYVSLVHVLQKLMNHPDFVSHFSRKRTSDEGLYSSYIDGKYCTDNELFSKDENALMVALYTDDWETVNPLGTSRKKHKLCAFYWTLANLPSKYRTRLSAIQMCILVRTDDVKHFGLNTVIEPLLRDLAFLETEGIFVENLGTTVRGSLAYISADNLGAHTIGRFNESFSPNVERICRFCLCTSGEIQDIGKTDFQMRTKQTHSHHIQMVKEGTAQSSTFGVKDDTPLNTLQYYHITNGLPPDVAHDLLEGIVPYELALALCSFTEKGYFSLDQFNEIIHSFPYQHHDSANRPQQIIRKLTFDHSASIGGNCHENWTLLRLLPLMIGDKVPADDIVWLALLELKDIVEYSFAPKMTEADILFFDSKIRDHKQLLTDAFPDFRFKPKHHFVDHYPHLMQCYGPLVQCYTLRFEGKHSFFKKVVRHIMNFKNLCMSLAERHQLHQAYLLAQPTYMRPMCEFTCTSEIMVDMLASNVKELCFKHFPGKKAIMQTNSVKIDGMDYKSGLAVACGSECGLQAFAIISLIIVDDGNVHFVCLLTESWYTESLRAFELCPAGSFVMLRHSALVDYYPLAVYEIRGKKYVTLKHHICVH